MNPPLSRKPSVHRRLVVLLTGLLIAVTADALPAAVTWEAYVGEPFGVGRITLGVERDQPSLPLEDERFTVVETPVHPPGESNTESASAGRVHYSITKSAPVRRILRRLLDIETPLNVTLYFVFQGDQPLHLEVYRPTKLPLAINPVRDPVRHRRLLEEWWQEYSGKLSRLRQNPVFPPVVTNYLAATLARRLALAMPKASGGLLPWINKKESAWDELFASEPFRLRLDRELIAGPPPEGELRSLPNPIAWSPPSFPADGLEEVAIESIAAHVPEESFYVRFGDFQNYLWFRDLSAKWHGDFQNMLLRRAIDQAASKRIEGQLSLRESALTKVLGPQVVADVAMVGLDPYFADGVAIGVLFQAKNNFLLASDLMSKRREALAKYPAAVESTVSIGGQDVSLIATPDNVVRSYYAQDGDFHLVTTSRSLVERFYRAGRGERSMAANGGFRLVRQRLPIDQGDAVFAYFSSAFFQQLASPEVHIELLRRLRSMRELKLMELARWAARAEQGAEHGNGKTPNGRGSGDGWPDLEELIRMQLLPERFGQHVDSSRLEVDTEFPYDTLRGRPGTLVPIADLELPRRASAEEHAAYSSFSARLKSEIGQLPPFAARIRRQVHPVAASQVNKPTVGETISADLFLPYTTGLKLSSWTEHLGQPSPEQLARVEGDVASIEAVLDVPVPLIGGQRQAHHLFGGLRDYQTPLVVRRGTIQPGSKPAELIRGYLGAWPRPGILELFGASVHPDDTGPRQVSEDIWQAGRDEFLLLSFKPEVVERVLPQLAIRPAERPAQVRVRIEDLTGKQITATVDALGYMRTREASVAACRLMNTLATQLHVPPAACLEVAEKLVDGSFVCPLGGDYQLVESKRCRPVWISTAISSANRFLLAAVPEDYQMPLLSWFRGLRGDLRVEDREIVLHLEIDMAAGTTGP
jgi:hypothetical protein